MKSKITAAAVHAAPVFMDKKATLQKVATFIKEAEGKVDYLVFPETFVPGYPVSTTSFKSLPGSYVIQDWESALDSRILSPIPLQIASIFHQLAETPVLKVKSQSSVTGLSSPI